jgi:hypothetical protein
MIHIKLSALTKADPTDPMRREWYGYSDQVSVQELFDNNRGRWVFGKRAEREQYVLREGARGKVWYAKYRLPDGHADVTATMR